MHIFFFAFFWAPLVLINYFSYNPNIHPFLKLIVSHFSNTFGAFLVWSGFLSFPSRYRTLRIYGRFNYIREYGTRVMRIMPLILSCFMIIMAFPTSKFSGPSFRESFSLVRESCKRNFIADISFTQYLLNLENLCIPPTWILAPDMMFFTASFPIIHLYYRSPVLGKRLIYGLIICAILMQAVYLHVFNYPPFVHASTSDVQSFMHNMGLHTNAVNYISSYLIGILASIWIHEGNSISGDSAARIFLLMMLIAYLPCYVWPYSWRFRQASRMEQIAYDAVYRTLVAVVVATLTAFQSTCGKEWSITKFMSCRLFVILGRFNYSLHLSHFLIIYWYIFTKRQPLEYDGHSMVTETGSLLMTSTVLAFLLHILFEAPMQMLSGLLFRRKIVVFKDRKVD